MNDVWVGWFVVFFVGLLVGMCVGIIDIGVIWMIDLKFGFCFDNFWFN